MTNRGKIPRMARDSFTQKSDILNVQKHGLRRLWAAVFIFTLVALAFVRYAFGFEASLLSAAAVFATALALVLVEKSKK